MCDTCGCNVTPGNRHLLEPEGKLYRAPDGRVAVHVLQGLLSENDRLAALCQRGIDGAQVDFRLARTGDAV